MPLEKEIILTKDLVIDGVENIEVLLYLSLLKMGRADRFCMLV